MKGRFCAVIIGDGPAALAAAIELGTARGVDVRLTLPVRAPAPRVGESLSPHGRALLARLGAWPGIVADESLPCFVTRSVWGPHGTRHVDYITHPLGPAWHVDRGRLGAHLRAVALEHGTRFDIDARSLFLLSRGPPWQCRHLDEQFVADVLIDATGRASWLGRRMGARRQRLDRQIAVVGRGPATTWPGDSMGVVEAVPGGWWYTAPSPSRLWTATFFTDADLLGPRARGGIDWQCLLAASDVTRERLGANGVDLLESVITAADTARLDRMAGEGWLAVGDAAMSYDPLSAHGLTCALQGGVDAARAVLQWRDGEARALDRHADRLSRAFDIFARERHALYRSESRFANHPYWQRRHHAAQADAGDRAGTEPPAQRDHAEACLIPPGLR